MGKCCQETSAMKLNWFSPLPPARTDIAHYTARVLPFLAQHADVLLWTDQSKWDKKLEIFGKVISYTPGKTPWKTLNQSDLTLFNIGNNADFHQSILDIANVHPGVIILHDISLHDFFAGIHICRKNDANGYLSLMKRYYGADGLESAKAFLNGSMNGHHMSCHYPLTAAALDNALGVVVHTMEAFSTLTQARRWPTCYAPLPFLPTDLNCNVSAPPTTTGAIHPPMKAPLRLIVFGYIGPNRCLDIVFQALAEFPGKDKFQLDIYGELHEKERILKQINALKLKRHVHLHGFVPEIDLDLALAAADLSINLRYPTMGEASGSQLRIWNHSLPSLVTRTGWYASLPREAVFFVNPGNEVADIHACLNALINTQEQFTAMGKNGRNLLETHHHPKAYVSALMDFFPGTQTYTATAEAFNLSTKLAQDSIMSILSDDYPSTLKTIASHIHELLV